MKRVLIPGVILCGADVAQAVDDKNMYMHVFEEMTVYAPVPVPVNGNTHYTSESIERLPTGNGNISDLLRTNPAVRMDSTQSTSLNQGDIRPEKISIHGASPYQNAYLIDGISATNNLNPANESDASSATNISGMSQGYYLDVSLLDNVTLYDSFVPVEFGRFNGGVIDAKIKRFNADDSSVKLGYRTTRSDWLTSHIDENNKSAFNQGSSGSTYYSPDFKKNFYTLSFNQELADNFGVTAGLSRRQSDITRADYVSNDGIVAGRAQYKNVIDTALSKFTWFASDRFTHDLTLKYTGSSRDYNTSTFPESDREMGNKSYGLAWDMDTQLAWAKLRTTVGWDHISDYTRHDHDIWYTELSCTYGDISGRCTRGGLGHISQAVDNYTFKTRLDWQKFTVGNVSHQPYFGAEYIYSDAWTERHNQSESYVINAAGKKTNHTIYHKGKGSLGIDNYTLYMADRISWRNVSLMPGVRYDYDNYLSNHNISPRFMTEWDIFADQTSMITAGYNRYYGGNILDMGLRDIRNSWTESVSGNKTLTRYQDLKTPYNDELAMGLQQKIGKNVIARANYVYREAHDQISKSSRTDSATKTTITEYNNDGKTKTHSFNLSFELAEPLHISQVDINPQIVFSYIKSKGNLSLNNGYEESNTGDNRVVYNGNLVSYDSVPVADFNNPLKISLNMDFTHQPSGLVWANIRQRDGAPAGILQIKTSSGAETSAFIERVADISQHMAALALEQEKSRQHIEQLIQFDPMTGLPNRNNLHNYLDDLVDKAVSPVVYLIGVDHIQDVIDSLGYAWADQALLEVVNRFREKLKPDQYLCRIEGASFVLVSLENDVSNITQIADELRNVVSKPIMIDDKPFPLTLSIGISYDVGKNRDYLLSTAHNAMDFIRKNGGNGWQFFSPAMNEMVKERLVLGAALKEAISNNQLKLVYQPQIFAETGELYGIEALARWYDPLHGHVPPSRFIPLAEEIGEIENIGRWVIAEACRQLAEWRSQNIHIPALSVNLSALHFRSNQLPNQVSDAMHAWGIDGHQLTVEITESMMMEHDTEIFKRIQILRDMGIGLSVDDFGTGFSGLSRLVSLPVTEIKIDKSFVDRCLTEKRILALLEAITSIGQSLNLTVVAEGIETKEQFEMLRKIHCRVIQGYFFSRPLPAEEIPGWMSSVLPLKI